MVIAPIPANEDARLAALRDLLLLDTLPEVRYNNIVEYAAAEFNVPMVLISLVDNDRQWFKASVGMDVCETSRDISFCGHAILAPETMVVRDALEDVRFMDNPLVLGEPHIRFYAGAPLVLPEGEIVGTLCLLDIEPRHFKPAELSSLGKLRSLVVEQLMTGAVIV
ncbi:GAF domain protein [Hydrogenophaga sp. RAC07]|uniref:GAF domain-containing protein n=1 Tax=Hydrogenophaga sp. RAC07 TaxID=1842537 RepID=UPI00083DEB14|nr:GAF domain-containing protein [Hydrogenophaga sp. RAC07]AOF85593.1 GAF domain protein [Hydrogenophaga sp. RAC07]